MEITTDWLEGPLDGWVKCGKCGRNIPHKEASEVGCTNQKCVPKVRLKVDPIVWEPKDLIHKFVRNPCGDYSSKEVIGVYNVKGDIYRNKKMNPVYSLDVPPKPHGATRFVCISDTHESYSRIPNGDVLLHAGDFTYAGTPEAVKQFNEWLGKLPHPHKVVIAGNHDVTFDIPYFSINWSRYGKRHDPISTKNLLTNCIYLEDSEVTIAGIRIYGSPWQPEFGNWAFNVIGQEAIKKYWDLIPTGIDILMTHGPPLNHCGVVDHDGQDAGCPQLLKAIHRTKPKVHVFGHIHEGYGVDYDGSTVFVNASSLNSDYKPTNSPVVFDLV